MANDNASMQTITTYDPVKGTFTLTKANGKDAWSGTFPISELQSWLAFYREQQLRYPGHAETYGEDVQALEALAAEIEMLLKSGTQSRETDAAALPTTKG